MKPHKKSSLLIAGMFALASTVSAVTPAGQFVTPLSGEPGRIEGTRVLSPSAMKSSEPRIKPRLSENNPLVPPFCETFDNFRSGSEHEDFRRYFETIDNDGDGRSWGFYNYAVDRPYGRCAYMFYPDGTTAAADDWLITRAVRLEKGKYYCISVYAGLYNEDSGDTPQVFEVNVGTYNDASGLSTVVIPKTSVYSKTMKRAQGWFTPSYTAIYYIGVHGISPSYSNYYNYLFIDNIAVDAPRVGSVPAEVTDVVMTNDPNGTNAVNIAFTAPKTALDGSELKSITSIVVKRGSKTVKTISPVKPGDLCTLTDTPEADGYYEYNITAANESGEGALYNCGHNAGIAEPVAPVVTTFEELDNGNVKLAWTAPDKDVNGNTINPDILAYNVVDCSGDTDETIVSGFKGTETTFDPNVSDGRQKMIICSVTAAFDDKTSEPTLTEFMPVGTPYPLPHHNSFTLSDHKEYVMSTEVKDDVVWRLLDDYSDPHAQDGDNGYICMIGSQSGQSCELRTGKIDFRGTTDPLLSFYTYVYGGDENQIKISITDMATYERTAVTTINLKQYNTIGWQRIALPLNEFAGKVVSIGIEGVIKTHGYIPLDNMSIEELTNIELATGAIDYPRRAEIDTPFNISATVINNGKDDITDYTVTLLAGDREITTVNGEPVKHLGEATVTLQDKFTSISPASTEYRVRINVKGDSNPDNNLSDPFTIVFMAPNYPSVIDLCGVENDKNVSLSWTAPDLSSAAPEEVTEGFESYPAFATSLDGWTLTDCDGGYVGGFGGGYTMPVDETNQPFWVMASEGSFKFIPTHSGSKSLVAMYAIDGNGRAVDNDDWLISPELYGGSQSLSFWAKSFTEEYGRELMEVLYSTSGTELSDFDVLIEMTEVPVNWTNYFVALPEGTKHFAIRYLSDNRYMLILDDFTYIPAGAPRALELKGYNVYRNGVRLNDTPVTGTTYETSREKDADYYYVTAVYDIGESIGSNVVNLGGSGITGITSDPASGPVELFNLQGIKVDASSAVPGIYIRRCGEKVDKVIVR